MSFEGLVTLDLTQVMSVRVTCFAPVPGHARHASGPVLLLEKFEAAGREERLVITGGHEEEEADRAARHDFLVRQRTGKDNRICEDEPASRLENPFPLSQSPCSVAKMVDGVDADEGVERGLDEGRCLASISQLNATRSVSPLRRSKPPSAQRTVDRGGHRRRPAPRASFTADQG
jgi:hypothetical protein